MGVFISFPFVKSTKDLSNILRMYDKYEILHMYDRFIMIIFLELQIGHIDHLSFSGSLLFIFEISVSSSNQIQTEIDVLSVT